MKKSQFYKKLENNFVQCRTCCHYCRLAPGEIGQCQVRKNIKGDLYSLVYGKIIAQGVDPIEKKPLYEFLPGTFTYSLATPGCNFSCLHCQNADIAKPVEIENFINEFAAKEFKPQEIIDQALQYNCQSISYTYTEPTVFADFALDIMKQAKKANLKNVWVSNGYFSNEVFTAIKPYLDAVNIDLKTFNDKTYQKICGAHLEPVKENIKKAVKAKVHTEVTTLLIPEVNDRSEEIKRMAEFLYSVDPKIVWHISAFYPAYKMIDKPPTDIKTLKKIKKIAKKCGLTKTFLGNI